MTGRPRNFNSGRLRHRITVQSYSDTQDAAGQPVASWADWLASEPADHEDTAGGQMMRGKQIQEGVSAVFTVRYRDGYTTHQRVVYGGENYGIERVHRVDGRTRYLELHCKRVEA